MARMSVCRACAGKSEIWTGHHTVMSCPFCTGSPMQVPIRLLDLSGNVVLTSTTRVYKDLCRKCSEFWGLKPDEWKIDPTDLFKFCRESGDLIDASSLAQMNETSLRVFPAEVRVHPNMGHVTAATLCRGLPPGRMEQVWNKCLPIESRTGLHAFT